MRFSKARLNAVSIAAVLSFVLPACSGHAGSSSILPSTAGVQRGAGHGLSAHSASGTSVSGTIVAMIAGGFTLDAGSGCGYVHVYTNSSTAFSGPTPAAGLLASIAGTGSCATSYTATSVTTSTNSTGIATPAPIPLQSTTTVGGSIVGLISGGFTINGGHGIGYMHVYTNSSTTFAGGTPKIGLYAQSTGTGSITTSITAGYVALYSAAPTSLSVTGVATSAASFGFTANAGSGFPAVPIVMNKLTIVGGSPLVTGSTVKVTGTGSEGEAVLASSIVVSTPTPAPGSTASPTPGPIPQKHILTADYLGTPYGTTSVSASAAAPYLTWAQTGWQNANSISAAGIKTQAYVDPNRTQATGGDPLYTTNEATFAHDCNGNRVTDVYNNTVTQYVMDITGSAMQSLFGNYVKSLAGMGHFDAIYEDDSGPLSSFIYSPFSAMPCNYADAAWLSAGQAMNQSSSVPIIFNGLQLYNGQSPSLSMGLLSSTNTIGGNLEHCYSDTSQAEMGGWVWQATENTELEIAAQHKLFECQLRNMGSASTSSQSRIYALASFLLTYDPATSVLWEEFATPSGMHVEPEEQLVLLDPVVLAPSNVTALQQTGGTFGRQYAQCYLAGNFVGPCAVVVNSTSSSAPFPYPQYSHTLTLSGGGVLDGGTVSTNGPAPALTIAPSNAAIVFP